MSVEAVAISFAIATAVIVVGVLAWDFGRRWLQERASVRTNDASLAVLSARIDEIERREKMLAEDWRKKFGQVERDWEQFKLHAQGQFNGTLAQLESQQRKGFGR